MIIASVVAATTSYLYYTTRVFGFEQNWLHKASEIVLENGETIKNPEDIRSYLDQFEIDNDRLLSVRMDYGHTVGHIMIDGKKYPLLVTKGDKFVGKSLRVETRLKGIELFEESN